MAQRSAGVAAGVVLGVLLLALAWRPLSAWYRDDLGNLAFLHGDSAAARASFEFALRQEPQWSFLHEDLGRVLLATDPTAALQEFRVAACGSPCIAEEGDALLRLGRVQDAIGKYVSARAATRVFARAQELASQGRYAESIALEEALVARLHDNFLERAELASAYASLGTLEDTAAYNLPRQASTLRARATRALHTASDLAPFNEGYLLAYGFSEMQYGDRSHARAAFQRVLRLHPHQQDAERALARLDQNP